MSSACLLHCLIMVLLQLSEQVLVSDTVRVRYASDDSTYQYYEWVKNLTIPAVEMSNDTSYKCTVQIGRLSNSALYSFTVVGSYQHLLFYGSIFRFLQFFVFFHALTLLVEHVYKTKDDQTTGFSCSALTL